MTERGLVFEHFADKVDEIFVISQDGVPALPLTLKEATKLNPAFAAPGIRPPFSLTFLARDPCILPQSLYRMEHQELGAAAIFLVAAAKDAGRGRSAGNSDLRSGWTPKCRLESRAGWHKCARSARTRTVPSGARPSRAGSPKCLMRLAG